MKIILNINGKEEAHQVDSNNVVVGRSTQCQVTIKSDHISRKHLEITEREGNYYAKDLTIGNWVSYNGDKMEKNAEIQIFDFCDVLLPGNITLKISNKSAKDEVDDASRQFNFETDKSLDVEKTVKKKNRKKLELELDTDIYQDLVNTSTGGHTRDILELKIDRNKIKSKDRSHNNFRKYLLMTIFIISCGVITGLLIVPEDGKKSQNKVVNNKSGETKKKRTARRKPKARKSIKNTGTSLVSQLKNNLVQYSKTKPKCSDELSQYCDDIFIQRNLDEGVEIKGKILTIYKDYELRLVQLFSGQAAGYVTAKSIFYSEYIVAAHQVLDPKFLEKVEKNGIFKIRIILFTKSGSQLKLKSSFSIDSSYYRRFNSSDYIKSIKLFIEKQNYSKFQRVFNKYITKEV